MVWLFLLQTSVLKDDERLIRGSFFSGGHSMTDQYILIDHTNDNFVLMLFIWGHFSEYFTTKNLQGYG